MLASNISSGKITENLDLWHCPQVFSLGAFYTATTPKEVDMWGPLGHWNAAIEELTRIRRNDLVKPYRFLLHFVKRNIYTEELKDDKSLDLSTKLNK